MSMARRITEFVKTYSTGVIAASISVVFATYMLLTRNGADIFPESAIVVSHVPVNTPLTERLEFSIVPSRLENARQGQPLADQIVTGSVSGASGGKQSLLMPLNTARKRPGRRGRARYYLRFATPDVALVENSGRLWSVEPGDLLPGAGRVLRIEKRGKDRWVLKTFDGKHIGEIISR